MKSPTLSFARALPMLCLTVALTGCSSAPPPQFDVSGAPASIASLAGRWVGDYRIADGSRHGVVTFDLSPGDSIATGSVIMQHTAMTTAAPVDSRQDLPHSAGAELTVKFVQVESGMVRGQLDPYTEPECACPVLTIFEGRLKDDSIEGTFSIRNTINGDKRIGTWRVLRQK